LLPPLGLGEVPAGLESFASSIVTRSPATLLDGEDGLYLTDSIVDYNQITNVVTESRLKVKVAALQNNDRFENGPTLPSDLPGTLKVHLRKLRLRYQSQSLSLQSRFRNKQNGHIYNFAEMKLQPSSHSQSSSEASSKNLFRRGGTGAVLLLLSSAPGPSYSSSPSPPPSSSSPSSAYLKKALLVWPLRAAGRLKVFTGWLPSSCERSARFCGCRSCAAVRGMAPSCGCARPAVRRAVKGDGDPSSDICEGCTCELYTASSPAAVAAAYWEAGWWCCEWACRRCWGDSIVARIREATKSSFRAAYLIALRQTKDSSSVTCKVRRSCRRRSWFTSHCRRRTGRSRACPAPPSSPGTRSPANEGRGE